MNRSLVPLQIPSGWAVLINHFGDEDPIVRDESIVNDQYYSQDLLWIQSMKHENDVWVIDSDGHLLDLGWYPDSDPGGNYRLVVMRRDWSNVLMKIESKDRREIGAAIGRCLELITQGVDDQSIARLLKTD